MLSGHFDSTQRAEDSLAAKFRRDRVGNRPNWRNACVGSSTCRNELFDITAAKEKRQAREFFRDERHNAQPGRGKVTSNRMWCCYLDGRGHWGGYEWQKDVIGFNQFVSKGQCCRRLPIGNRLGRCIGGTLGTKMGLAWQKFLALAQSLRSFLFKILCPFHNHMQIHKHALGRSPTSSKMASRLILVVLNLARTIKK